MFGVIILTVLVCGLQLNLAATTIDSAIRSGMNADISILTAEKQNVLVIPKAAIITKDGMIYVNIITDKKHKKYQEQKIETGLLGDGNLIEVKSGLSDGDQIAIISK
jgi:multidrug efflux pump subunit AcrA (membrane-fusion protein)